MINVVLEENKMATKKKVTKKDEEKKVEVVEKVVEVEAEKVEEPKEEKKPEKKVEIKKEAVQDNRPVKKDVKIKMARNHRCHIGGDYYDLKEGQTYNVPEFVKYVLAKAGVLAPL